MVTKHLKKNRHTEQSETNLDLLAAQAADDNIQLLCVSMAADFERGK